MLTDTIKKAAKDAYEMTGGRASLEDPTIIPNALGDLLGKDSKILRHQITMAMESGLGTLFLRQLDQPAPGFREKTVEMLEDSGLNSEVSSDIFELFVYMTGMAGGETIIEGGEGNNPGEEGEVALPPKKKKKPPVDQVNPLKKDVRFDRPVPQQMHSVGFYAGWSFFGVGALLTPLVGPPASAVALIGIIILIVHYVGSSRYRAQYSAVVKGDKGIFTFDTQASCEMGILVNKQWAGFMNRGENSISIDLNPGKNKYIIFSLGPGSARSIASGTLTRLK